MSFIGPRNKFQFTRSGSLKRPRSGNGGRVFKKPRIASTISIARPQSFRAVSNARIGGFIGLENKFYDTSLAASALTTPGDAAGGEHDPSATIVLNSVIQGNGESNRDGRNIKMNSVHLNGLVSVAAQINKTAADAGSIVTIALVLDQQTNGATIASENVYKNQSASGTLAASPFRNLEFVKRFKILKTIHVTMPPVPISYDGTNIEQAGQQKPWRMNVQLGGMVTNYSGTTETVANIVDNSLHVVAFCSNLDQVPLLYYNARLRFFG